MPSTKGALRRHPVGFPFSPDRLRWKTFENWCSEIIVPNVPVFSPTTTATAAVAVDEIVRVCNWAASCGYWVRPSGVNHGWSPFVLGPDDRPHAHRIVLIDMSGLTHDFEVDQSRAEFPCPVVRCSSGVLLCDLIRRLQATPLKAAGTAAGTADKTSTAATGFSFPNTPSLASLTVGGVLAVGGHGTSLDPRPVMPGADVATEGGGHGCLSNRIVEMTIIAYDPAEGQYRPKTLRRRRRAPAATGDEDEDDELRAYMCCLGRTIILHVVLAIEPSRLIRGRSYFHLTESQVFAEPTAADPVPKGSFQEYFNRTGRVDIIWFNHVDPGKNVPWLRTMEDCSERPRESVEVTHQLNYRKVQSPSFFTSLFSMAVGYPVGKAQLKDDMELLQGAVWSKLCAFAIHRKTDTDAKGDSLRGCPQEPPRGYLLTGPLMLFQRCVTRLTRALNAQKRMPAIATTMAAENAKLYAREKVTDLWGPSGHHLIAFDTQTMRLTTNGYGLLMQRDHVQRALAMFVSVLRRVTRQLAESKGWHPFMIMDARVSGLDRGGDIPGMAPSSAPLLTATAWEPDCASNGWDCVLWVNVLSLPRALGVNEFYAELEGELRKTYRAPFAKLRVEYSKGWAYTAEGGPQTDAEGLQFARNQLPGFRHAVRIFDKNDPKDIFQCEFLKRFCILNDEHVAGAADVSSFSRARIGRFDENDAGAESNGWMSVGWWAALGILLCLLMLRLFTS